LFASEGDVLLLEELITTAEPNNYPTLAVQIKLDAQGRNKKGVTSLFGREQRFAAIGVEAASPLQIRLSVAGDDRILPVNVSLRASIADAAAAERAGVASVKAGWANAIEAEIKAAFVMGANGRDFKSLLALCGADGGSRALMAALAPGFHSIGLSLLSAVAKPVEPPKPVLDFNHPFEIQTDGVRISPDISFSLERDPDRSDVYYTSLATTDTIKNKLHTDIRDHLTDRYSLQQWRFESSIIRDRLTRLVNDKATEFGRKVVNTVTIRTPEERPNKPIETQGQASFPVPDSNRRLVLDYSASLRLSEAATWERIKLNDPGAAADISGTARQVIETSLASILRSTDRDALLNVLAGQRDDVGHLKEAMGYKIADGLRAYGWSAFDVAIVPASIADSLLTKKRGNVETGWIDYSLAFSTAKATIECAATVEVVDAPALLAVLREDELSNDLVVTRLQRAIDGVLRSTTANAFFEFGSSDAAFDIAPDVQTRMIEAANVSLSQIGLRLSDDTGTRRLSGNTIEARTGSKIAFRLGTSPVLQRLADLRNLRDSVTCDEIVTDIHGISYPVKFDIRFVVQNHAEENKAIFIDHSLKYDLREHIAMVKQTITDTCIGILRRIPANYYYRDNLRTSMLDGGIATLAMSRVEIYHGLVIDIPPGHVTILIRDDNNAETAAYKAIRANQQNVLDNLTSADPIDNWKQERMVEAHTSNSGTIQKLISDGHFAQGGLGGGVTFEGLRENLYPQLQYIAEDEKARNALAAFLDRGYGHKKLAASEQKNIESSGENTGGSADIESTN
jgi:hypothetical protein